MSHLGVNGFAPDPGVVMSTGEFNAGGNPAMD